MNKVELETKETIANKLSRYGIRTNLRGYYYLQEAIYLVVCDNEYAFNISKRLYPEIAKKFDVTASRVERCIRHALEFADYEVMKSCYVSTSDEKPPKNSEFISAVAQLVIFEQIKAGLQESNE